MERRNRVVALIWIKPHSRCACDSSRGVSQSSCAKPERDALVLSDSDDGVAMAKGLSSRQGGLGSSIVEALTKQLHAECVRFSTLPGEESSGGPWLKSTSRIPITGVRLT